MLNPSTASETTDDATIRRCTGFAMNWGYAGFVVVNLFGWRATDPKELKHVEDPIGEFNEYWIKAAIDQCGELICAWGCGSHIPRKYDPYVKMMLAKIKVPKYHLGLRKDGQPRHPLMLPYTVERTLF